MCNPLNSKEFNGFNTPSLQFAELLNPRLLERLSNEDGNLNEVMAKLPNLNVAFDRKKGTKDVDVKI